MKAKRLFTGIYAVILTASLNVTTFGASIEHASMENNINITEEISNKIEIVKKNDKEMKAKYKDLMEKWNALSDVQKEEIYKLKDVSVDVECRIIEKYLEFGIIDSETATNLKAKKAEYKTEMRKSGKLPGHGLKYKSAK